MKIVNFQMEWMETCYRVCCGVNKRLGALQRILSKY